MVIAAPEGVDVRVVNIAEGTTTVVRTHDSDTVAGVKAKISCFPNFEQRLLLDGVELADDGAAVGSCGLLAMDRPTLHLLHQPVAGPPPGGKAGRLPPGFEGVYVDDLMGGGHAIEAQAADTVGGIRERLRDRAGLPAGQPRLLFEGRELCDDGQALGSLGVSVQARSTLYMLPPPPAGTGGGEPARAWAGGEGPAPAEELVERRLDDMWFRARVVRRNPTRGTIDIEYLDDGKTEVGVKLSECHVLPSPVQKRPAQG